MEEVGLAVEEGEEDAQQGLDAAALAGHREEHVGVLGELVDVHVSRVEEEEIRKEKR